VSDALVVSGEMHTLVRMQALICDVQTQHMTTLFNLFKLSEVDF